MDIVLRTEQCTSLNALLLAEVFLTFVFLTTVLEDRVASAGQEECAPRCTDIDFFQDVPISMNTDHYMLRNIESNQNYSSGVTIKNGVDEDLPAIINISTTSEPDMQQPIQILGGAHKVLKQSVGILNNASVIYETKSEIRGVAVHVASAKLFISTSKGYVYRTSIFQRSEPEIILNPDHVNFSPLSLSVDWLNLHLYVLGEKKYASTEWQIVRCNLDGTVLVVVVPGLKIRPSHIEVDPYNGYLFWVTKVGLFRLDLADVNNAMKHKGQPKLILQDTHLGAFTVDHTKLRLLVTNHTKKSLISVSLDGREVHNFHLTAQKQKYYMFVPIFIANAWPNFPDVNLNVSNTSFISVNVLANSSQPVPIPINPPTNVQAVLGVERAKISWQVPHLSDGQGKGAWQNWLYELEIKDEFTGETIYKKDIDGISHTVHNLRKNSKYLIKAAAYTNAGRGSWSTEFRGQILRDDSNASILWSSNEGFVRSDVTGENIDTLIYKANLKEYDSEFHIVDVSWYKDVLYIVGSNSALYSYNISSHQKTKLNINSVSSVAVDWISKKLYWVNAKEEIIWRANFNGSNEESFFFSNFALDFTNNFVKEIIIDSLEAYLYWSTDHTVKVARLNGYDNRYYYLDGLMKEQIMGLTFDTENKYVYWIVRSYESETIVYRAPTSERIPMDNQFIPDIFLEKVSALQHTNMQGPLCYFSEHLLWLEDDKNAVISNLSAQNTAVINGITSSSLYMVAVMDPTFHQYPKNLSSNSVVVLPNAVDEDSISVKGTWKNFNISWNPVKNINYGTVFYEVKLTNYINIDSNPTITMETTMPYKNTGHIHPYSILKVSVKAFTYWDTAHHSRKILRSPQSVPSQPTSPRAFVEFYEKVFSKDVDIIAFRWNQPKFTNGIILGYTVQCWFTKNSEKNEICSDHSIPASSTLEYKANYALPNTTYYFQVRAHTEIGAGPYTNLINVTTTYENPVLRLLVATTDAVKISDLDQKINYTLTRDVAIEVGYLSIENKIYWINRMMRLVMSDESGANATKILALENNAHSLCIDWVARNLYWSEDGNRDNSGYSGYIMKLDLTMLQAGIVKYENIVRRTRRIVSLDVLPSQGSLYWIESTNDRGTIMQSDLDGKSVQPFFKKDVNNTCSCPYRPSMISAMTIDKTNIQKPLMYWMMKEHLKTADIYGCMCDVVLNANFNKETSLTVDKMNIYWCNKLENQIFFLKKDYRSFASKENASELEVKSFYLLSVRRIKALGKSLQPHPDAKCLIPRQVDYNIKRVNETASSILVDLPEPVPELDCEKYSLPTTLYTINMSECLDNNCENPEPIQVQTYVRLYEIQNLKPFTTYKLKLALSNFYTNLSQSTINLEFGSGVVLRTGTGRPSVPENVTFESLTPTLAAVYWMPPKILNSAAVYYDVCWRSVLSENGLLQTGELQIKEPERTADGRFFTTLQPLLPDQEYEVYVRVYPVNLYEFHNQSPNKTIRMYSEPNNLTISGVTVNSMNISWIPTINLTIGCVLEYKDVAMDEWQVAYDVVTEGNEVIYYIKGLQPRTLYKFRLLLKYPAYEMDFIWPTDGRFIFQTLGDVPSAPGMTVVTRLRSSIYQLSWEPAQAHGSQVTLYRLEGIVVDNDYKQDNEVDEKRSWNWQREEKKYWNLYYNGTDSYWIITGDMDQKYLFRVQAKNAYGFGAWSKLSAVVDLTGSTEEMSITQLNLPLILSLIPIVITIMLLCFCYFFRSIYRQCKEETKAVLPSAVSDVELATLLQIPRGNFVQSNALYASTLQSDSDDFALPKIRQEQITLAKFLGSGAFGKVYQGNAKDLEGLGIMSVAIKMLRKNASLQEKTEFLKEARLMSHFQHKHVLRLLGVCLDTDSPLLVLELMEAGDLLSYLREGRSLPPTDSNALRLQDLLAMCEDVARGCRYLEELHFVHRDLACRNCLVSARDRKNRIVKISDFGLARDIYKNDYYRKEGEGLLPVRWMAPESLVDGVFTSQSDVWAFAVLIWEITSLGQQPYPARTNLEVLHYVRAGGRLPKPLNCPQMLHQLMLRCWSAADGRPSFKVCLENIVALRSNIEDAILSPVHAGYYLTHRENSRRSSKFEES